jgi:hypothetical protein
MRRKLSTVCVSIKKWPQVAAGSDVFDQIDGKVFFRKLDRMKEVVGSLERFADQYDVFREYRHGVIEKAGKSWDIGALQIHQDRGLAIMLTGIPASAYISAHSTGCLSGARGASVQILALTTGRFRKASAEPETVLAISTRYGANSGCMDVPPRTCFSEWVSNT